jgi:hypothetical protein
VGAGSKSLKIAYAIMTTRGFDGGGYGDRVLLALDRTPGTGTFVWKERKAVRVGDIWIDMDSRRP